MRVLIVEDEKSSQFILKTALIRHGHEVQLCDNGAEGLWAYLRNPDSIDTILLDIMMPEVTGEDFLRVVESLVLRGQLSLRTKIIVTTAMTDDSDLKRLLRFSCVWAVCQKPLDLRLLGELIAEDPARVLENKFFPSLPTEI